MPSILTAKQKTAYALDQQNHSDATIARMMGLRHRQSAAKLLARARKRVRELRLACALNGGDSGALDMLFDAD